MLNIIKYSKSVKKLFYFFVFFSLVLAVNAQTDAVTYYETGKKFLIQGDLDNATLVLKKAVNLEPTNATYLQDLVSAYSAKEDFITAKDYSEKLLALDDASEYAYFLSANINQALNDTKTADKIIKKGIKKYENSGLLYDALGQSLSEKDAYNAIIQWEMGIQKDPTYSGNYYNAARYHFFSKNVNAKIWSIYYGEIFINMESRSERTIEIKDALLESYKAIAEEQYFSKKGSKNDFENLFIENFNLVKYTIATGVTTENLIQLRALFIYNWFNQSTVIHSSLYDRMQQLMREGHFEEYNYWIFEPIQNLAGYDNWLKTNQNNFDQFMKYHQTKLFKMTNTEYLK